MSNAYVALYFIHTQKDNKEREGGREGERGIRNLILKNNYITLVMQHEKSHDTVRGKGKRI